MDSENIFLTGEEIVAATGGYLLAGAISTFFGISTDTREELTGKLFIPLRGKRFDGHNFLGEALKKGAVGVLVARGKEFAINTLETRCTVIVVEDTLKALGDIARYWRQKKGVKVVAVTGSAGKTTTKEMIAAILSQQVSVLKTEGNMNNLVGLPLTLLRLTGKHDMAVLEMGTNRPGEIRELCRICEPDVGIITNIGPAHLEGFGTIDSIREEKGEIYKNLPPNGTAVINEDDENVKVAALKWKGKKVTFGLSKEAWITVSNIRYEKEEIVFDLYVGREKVKTKLNATGRHNVMNALAAAAVAYALGVDRKTIAQGLGKFSPLTGRFQIHHLANDIYLIDDTYNANPLSVREALVNLKNLRGKHRGFVVFGDMLELGKEAQHFHRGIGEMVGETGVCALFVKGCFAEDIARGAKRAGLGEKQIFFFSQPKEVVEILFPLLNPGDWVLVKGSRAMEMERVVHELMAEFGKSFSLEKSAGRR